jgi:hypothetical protein
VLLEAVLLTNFKLYLHSTTAAADCCRHEGCGIMHSAQQHLLLLKPFLASLSPDHTPASGRCLCLFKAVNQHRQQHQQRQ